MRITRLRNTQRLFNKVDKRYYLVTNAAIGEVSAIDENGMIIPDEPVLTVTEENSICFRIDKEAEPSIPKGYSVENGCIIKPGGEAVNMGERIVKKIFAATENHLILAGTYKGVNEIMTYNVERDRFENGYEATDPFVLYKDNGYLVVADNIYKDVTVPATEEAPETTKSVFDYALIYMYKGSNCDCERLDFKINDCLETLDKNEKMLMVLDCSRETEEESVPEIIILSVVKNNSLWLSNYREVKMNPAAFCYCTIDYEGNTVVICDDGFSVIRKNEIVRVNADMRLLPAGMNTLVDCTVNNHRGRTCETNVVTKTWTFADSNLKVGKIVETQTFDRGMITEVYPPENVYPPAFAV